MDLVNLMYYYVNRIINSEELLVKLAQLDLSKYSDDEKEKIEQLIQDIKEIKKTHPNEIDDFQKNRSQKIDKMLDMLTEIKDKENNESIESIEKQYKKLLIEKETIQDGGKLFEKIFELLTHHVLVNKYASKMNDIELLEFIAQFISVPLPPEIDQEAFNDLALAGINADKREDLWRLAFNYNHKNKDFSLIENYFIAKKDAYYLTELISAVGEDINMLNLINKIIDTHDKDFIKKVAEKSKAMGIIGEEMYNALNTDNL